MERRAMANPDLLIYAVHAVFWACFVLTRILIRGAAAGDPHSAPAAAEAQSAPHSHLVLGVHTLAFWLMYYGVSAAVIPHRVPSWFPGQALAGTAVIALGGVLACWAQAYFRSWRYLAKLDQGHQLATGGPFRYLRHPIYLALNLMALGSALWVPTLPMWIAFALMLLGSDLRARAEEALLARAFGSTYTDYCKGTRRFIPGLY
jgi:protein-S-isoprenylcysteine O-methyltransferase Ste14